MTQRRNRLWSTFSSAVGLTALGTAGQQAVKIDTNLLTGLGLAHLAGYTVGPFYLELMITSDDDNTAVLNVKAHIGIGIFNGDLDNTDFPNLAFGDGDYLLRQDLVFQGPGTGSTLVLPTERSTRSLRSRSSRRLERIGDTIWFVAQQDTADDFDYVFTVTFMAMMP